LVELFESMGRPVKLAMSEGDREVYLRDVQDLEQELGIRRSDVDKERSDLVVRLKSNLWLTGEVREDILAQYDVKIQAINEMRRLLQETRDIALSEELVHP
jgi:hypothetical protein